MGLTHDRALVITVSDGVSHGSRHDSSGDEITERLASAGFKVDRHVVPDEIEEITAALANHDNHDLIVTTGGTGFGPRDVTPEATTAVLEREAPGLVHLMMARGLESTPNAALSRGRAGTMGKALIINLPGSPKGAIESLDAVLPLVEHTLQLINGDTEHQSD